MSLGRVVDCYGLEYRPRGFLRNSPVMIVSVLLLLCVCVDCDCVCIVVEKVKCLQTGLQKEWCSPPINNVDYAISRQGATTDQAHEVE